MLDVMAGYDPADPGTAFASGHVPKTFTAAWIETDCAARASACSRSSSAATPSTAR